MLHLRVRSLTFLVLLLSPWWLCGECRAALDPETHSPYQLQVVLVVARHALLTPTFQDRLQRELRDRKRACSCRLTSGPRWTE